MAMTNAERQRAYREKVLKGFDGLGLTRVQVLIEPFPNGCLNRMVKASGKTKRELIEEAILLLADKYDCRYGD